MLRKKYNEKMNKRNKEITEWKIIPLILFSLSFGHVTAAFQLVTQLDDENSVFKCYQTSQNKQTR